MDDKQRTVKLYNK